MADKELIERLDNGRIRVRIPQPDKVEEMSVEDMTRKRDALQGNIFRLQNTLDKFTAELTYLDDTLASIAASEEVEIETALPEEEAIIR